jgi:hypothetical protein
MLIPSARDISLKILKDFSKSYHLENRANTLPVMLRHHTVAERLQIRVKKDLDSAERMRKF